MSLLFLLLIAAGPAVADEEFHVHSASTRLVDHVYLLGASIDYPLSTKAARALNSGITLTFRLDIEVSGPRAWWPDHVIARLQQRSRLQYHALTEQYVVQSLNSGAILAYPSLDHALDALGTVDDFPLLDEKLLRGERPHQVSLQAKLEIESLPSPLRPLAYLSPSWWLSSDWHTCSLTP